ncbi:hypothetical protein K438DRAFT_1974399 [Mycena galopus ATCC 62051]|nr:hypothetical protein K438DRAFT_1974399 [Mycena galopus ATCC 62051]
MDAARPARTIDIELGGQEVITIDLDVLDTVDEILDLLSDPQCRAKAWVWTVVATEFWRKALWKQPIKLLPLVFEVNPFLVYCCTLTQYVIFKDNHWEQDLGPLDIMKDSQTKTDYHKEAAIFLNLGAGVDFNGHLAFLTRGVHQLATWALPDALTTFNGILEQKPTNLIALIGKVRPDTVRSTELSRGPEDISTGAGAESSAKAKAAWQRSLDVNPNEWPAQLLLGLDDVNASKNDGSSEAERTHLFTMGTRMIERAFKANQKSATAANALCELFLRKGSHDRALKLAECTIQFQWCNGGGTAAGRDIVLALRP